MYKRSIGFIYADFDTPFFVIIMAEWTVIKTRLLLDIYAYKVHAFVVYLFVINMGHFSSVVLHLLVRV